jgi:hypothetical protein
MEACGSWDWLLCWNVSVFPNMALSYELFSGLCFGISVRLVVLQRVSVQRWGCHIKTRIGKGVCAGKGGFKLTFNPVVGSSK